MSDDKLGGIVEKYLDLVRREIEVKARIERMEDELNASYDDRAAIKASLDAIHSEFDTLVRNQVKEENND